MKKFSGGITIVPSFLSKGLEFDSVIISDYKSYDESILDTKLLYVAFTRAMHTFDKYYWATENKDEVCKKENIDIMIDDFCKNCESIANSKIKAIYLKDAPSYDLEENKYIKVSYNWGEIYRYIKEMEVK